MKFSDFLNESFDSEWDVNWPDADAIKAVKSVLNKNDVIKSIEHEIVEWCIR